MLRSLKDLERYAVRATDGDVGTVVNFLFDDDYRTNRTNSRPFAGEKIQIRYGYT